MRTRFSLRLSPFTSFPFSQARKHNWPEYSGQLCFLACEKGNEVKGDNRRLKRVRIRLLVSQAP